MKCIKVTVFKYFQKVAIYIAPNASFLVPGGSGKLSSTWSPGECTDDDITPISFTLSPLPLIDRVCAAKACPGRDTNSLFRLCEC